ncbi:TPA: hypothetical protein ACH3X2_012349 [Trebouxia sp. C0005]
MESLANSGSNSETAWHTSEMYITQAREALLTYIRDSLRCNHSARGSANSARGSAPELVLQLSSISSSRVGTVAGVVTVTVGGRGSPSLVVAKSVVEGVRATFKGLLT